MRQAKNYVRIMENSVVQFALSQLGGSNAADTTYNAMTCE